MKRTILAAVAATALAGGVALAVPAQADTVTRSLVVNNGQFTCYDGYGNVTTDATKVATKSGSVKVSCHFPAGSTFPFPIKPKINVFTFGDCVTHDFNGNLIYLNSHDIINTNGSENMTCN